MSGRLVLLPKKSYTPWNPKNVERVLKDEALAREEQEKEVRAIREIESRNRLKELKGSEDGERQKHVNLFEREENDVVMEKKRRLQHEEEEGTKRQPSSRVYLHRTNDKNRVVPFYMTAQSQQQQYGLSATPDRNNMSFHDPMKRFYYQPTEETGCETPKYSNGTTLTTACCSVAVALPREKPPMDDNSYSSSSSHHAKKKKKKSKQIHRSRRKHRKSRSKSPKTHPKKRKREFAIDD
jgi:hypothetical protein